ncbi:NmrA-like [Penicillium atrosanguineum]|uniref:NmrA-like n=1 Tax=Penicillium atrosanguineum TaxID=1132637 RepID=A0A9W9QCM9_9EURO|nr:NmrA-like [Penicillium atrosanguineum]KAJ5331216.1 NmrA-like [Penicillium atrosanguineum]
MASNAQNRIIVVLGSTGHQGRGVVSSLLSDSARELWNVRAVTRDVNSVSAQRLLNDFQTPDHRLSLITGDFFDEESLQVAFSGAYGVFAVTSETNSRTIEHEDDLKQELESGKNIISAAKICRIQHFVLSSLPDMKRATSGRFDKLFHMDHKFIIEQLAKQDLSAVTCLLPGLFFTNLDWSHYCRREANGVVRFCPPIPSTKLVEWVDPVYDMGIFAAVVSAKEDLIPYPMPCDERLRESLSEVFALGIVKTKNKNYVCCSPKLRMDEFASTFTRVTGQPAIYSPISIDEWAGLASRAVGNGFKEDIRQMIEWISIAPEDKICYGALDPAEDSSWEDLHLQASTFEDWLRRSGWRGPPEGIP